MLEETSLQNIPKDILDTFNTVDIKPGDIFINEREDYATVKKVYIYSYQNYKKETIYEVKVDYIVHYGKDWNSNSDATLEIFKRKYVRVPFNDIAKAEKEAMIYLATCEQIEKEELSTSTALVMSQGKERLEQSLQSFNAKREMVEAYKRIIKRKVEALAQRVSEFNKQITRIQKVLGVFELYLGFYEKVVQIAEGLPASLDDPICIRQLVLFMDEEIVSELDLYEVMKFPGIEDFDSWVVNHYEKLVPESKCIVAMRISRQEKPVMTILGEGWGNWEEDKYCYLLIRNGANLYRIYTGMSIGSEFFPNKEDLVKFSKDLDDVENELHDDKVEDWQLRFHRNALLIQGLIDRTDIFNFTEYVSILDFNSSHIKYIYDAEASLPDGRLSYNDWKKQLNGQITRGTRIYFSKEIFNHGFYRNSGKDRFKRYYTDRSWNIPPNPDSGVYTIEEIETDRYGMERLYIYYNPKDTVHQVGWEYDPHERKNKLAFYILRDDDFVFNYDLLDLDSINYYLKSRYEKKEYLKLIPILFGLKKERLAELKWEKHFVNLVAKRNDVSEAVVWKAIEWWKNKVIWKRPIMQDDAKALRMIERRVKKECYIH